MIGRVLVYILLAAAGASIFMLSSSISYRLDLFDFDERALVYEFSPSADAWGFFDPDTGIVFEGENRDVPLPMASITKLFTAHAALRSNKLDSPVTIEWADLSAEGRAGKLAYGDSYTVHELLFPLLIESSNDAGSAIERSLGSEYTIQTNLTLQRLSLQSTKIVGPSGLHAGNVSTVEELARFYSYLKREDPHIIDITTLPVYIGRKTGWVNTSPARAYKGYHGGKHGYTPEAGSTFIGVFEVDGREIGVVFLGSNALDADLSEAIRYLEAAR